MLFLKQLQPHVLEKLLLFVLARPNSSSNKMLVFVAKLVSFDELKTDNKNTNKNSCVIFLSFST